MGIAESVQAVRWARRRQPGDVAYGIALGHERFSPRELLDQAVEAERAGFDIVCCSDHLAPWWDPSAGPLAHCANAWVWLGAAGHATSVVSLGPAVSAIVHRYNPVVMAQQAARTAAATPVLSCTSWPEAPVLPLARAIGAEGLSQPAVAGQLGQVDGLAIGRVLSR